MQHAYVGEHGGELIDMVDLTIGKDIGHVSFPPIPRQAGGVTAAAAIRRRWRGECGIAVCDVEWRAVEGGGRECGARPADVITRPTTTSTTNLFGYAGDRWLASQRQFRDRDVGGNGRDFFTMGTPMLYRRVVFVYGQIQSFFCLFRRTGAEAEFALGGLYESFADGAGWWWRILQRPRGAAECAATRRSIRVDFVSAEYSGAAKCDDWPTTDAPG